jgi:hypothetical protein
VNKEEVPLRKTRNTCGDRKKHLRQQHETLLVKRGKTPERTMRNIFREKESST